jgi:hypothetical protein
MVMRSRTALTAVTVAVLMAAFTPAAGAATPQPVLDPDDWEAPIVVDTDPGGTTQGLFDDDPTGLVPKTPFVQRYSLDQDHWEVWLCGSVSTPMPDVIAALEAATVDYYDSISGGVYEPVFTAGGSKPSDAGCLDEFKSGTYPTVGTPEGLLIVDSTTGSGGYASPGIICVSSDPDCAGISSTFPGNTRYAVLGEPALDWPSVIAHELGHALQWPHSNAGIGAEYDNPIDLMSGNSKTNGYSEPKPYATLSYNRFQSGWVSTSDVVVADGSYQAVTLQPHNVAGTQLFAIKTAQPGLFYVFGARTTSSYDPIPAAWQGVEVYEVDYYCGQGAFGGGVCPGIFRDQTQEPPSPGGVGHVLQPGESIVLEGLTVTVTGATATGYTMTADPDPGVDTAPSAPGTPTATAGDAEATLVWAAAGDGGSPILNYDVEVENRDQGGSTVTDVGVTLSTVAAGLSNGATYRARARATNAIGDGPWSAWSDDFLPGTVPAAPGAPDVVGGDETISASWTAPANDGGAAITNYELHLNDITAATDGYIDAGAGLSEEVAGLANGHSYRIRVRAENSLGIGAWSAWSAEVTPMSIPGAPSTPGVPDLVAGAGQVAAAWTAASGSGGSVDAYGLEIEDVTRGTSSMVQVGGSTLSHTFTSLVNGDGYRVRVRAHNVAGWGPWSAWTETVTPVAPSNRFVDDDDSVFETDIEWLAAADVTKGCNPPVNDMFCPDDPVTRGQMAAFLVRALGLSDRLVDPFVDDDGSVFETDIEKLAAAGITRGCNPPINDRFCPTDAVTREQMAAFLVRALGYTDAGGGDLFIDDDESVFESDIDRLATAGVTKGCNPPANDMFCPTEVVTRGQMAAFLHRALG